tara:strand:+ start:110 stop:448 length:339 start_codon:yes stop_codon:yes gene_type:complete
MQYASLVFFLLTFAFFIPKKLRARNVRMMQQAEQIKNAGSAVEKTKKEKEDGSQAEAETKKEEEDSSQAKTKEKEENGSQADQLNLYWKRGDNGRLSRCILTANAWIYYRAR